MKTDALQRWRARVHGALGFFGCYQTSRCAATLARACVYHSLRDKRLFIGINSIFFESVSHTSEGESEEFSGLGDVSVSSFEGLLDESSFDVFDDIFEFDAVSQFEFCGRVILIFRRVCFVWHVV